MSLKQMFYQNLGRNIFFYLNKTLVTSKAVPGECKIQVTSLVTLKLLDFLPGTPS